MKKFTLFFILAATVTAILLFGCSSKPVYKVTPENNSFDYYEGRELVTLEDSILTTVVNFEAQEKDFFVFYQKKHWENEVLRKTTLLPGHDVGGFLYLPVDYSALILKLVIPVDGKQHNYLFKQNRIK